MQPLNKFRISFPEKLELSHKKAPLIIYKYSLAPDEEKRRSRLTRETQLWIQHKSFVPIGTVKMMCKTINSFINSHFPVLKLWTVLYTEKHGVEKFSTPAHNQSRRGTIWTISFEAQLINWSQGKGGSINQPRFKIYNTQPWWSWISSGRVNNWTHFRLFLLSLSGQKGKY